MILCRTPEQLRVALERLPASRTLVPTMGGLHAGHLSLLEIAQRRGGAVLATIFVNRLQFDDPQDFAAYPRELGQDLESLRQAGADLAYVPDEADVWGGEAPQPELFEMPGLTDVLEGEHRPGHLRAVAAVVSRLFDQAMPTAAVFGEKDYQQLVLVRRLAAARPTPVEIAAAPVVREADGLAMSSRNRRLSPQARIQAAELQRSLATAARLLREGSPVALAQERAAAMLQEGGFQTDYVAARHAASWRPAGDADQDFVMLAAARLEDVRLLDMARARREDLIESQT